MSLRNNPYMPIYVRDLLADEKLRKCSANTLGIYYTLMFMLHLADSYGTYCLDKPLKSGERLISRLACQLAKSTQFTKPAIEKALERLIEVRLLVLTENGFYQPRMVQDNELSEIRAKCGKKGAEAANSRKFDENSAKTAQKAPKAAQESGYAPSKTAVEAANSYTDDPELKELILDWFELRAQRKFATTKKVARENLSVLEKCARDSHLSVKQYLREVIRRGWGTFYVVQPDKEAPPPKEKPSFSAEEFDDFTIGKYAIKPDT